MKNLTPHAIRVMNKNNQVITFEPSGVQARVSVQTLEVHTDSFDFPVVETTYGDVEGIGKPNEGPYLVSAMVLDRLGPEYSGWAFAPDTGSSAVRNDKGHVDYVVQLKTVPQPF